MAIFKDLLITGVYYAEHGGTDRASWTKMMTDTFGNQLIPHLDYIMWYSFMAVYKKAASRSPLKRELRRELKRIKGY